VFVSHAWGVEQANHKHVSKLVRELERIGLVVWFDEERLSRRMAGEISDGLNDSFLYLAYINKDFLEKIDSARTSDGIDWCSVEFSSTMRRQGPHKSLCVVCEPEFLN